MLSVATILECFRHSTDHRQSWAHPSALADSKFRQPVAVFDPCLLGRRFYVSAGSSHAADGPRAAAVAAKGASIRRVRPSICQVRWASNLVAYYEAFWEDWSGTNHRLS